MIWQLHKEILIALNLCQVHYQISQQSFWRLQNNKCKYCKSYLEHIKIEENKLQIKYGLNITNNDYKHAKKYEKALK